MYDWRTRVRGRSSRQQRLAPASSKDDRERLRVPTGRDDRESSMHDTSTLPRNCYRPRPMINFLCPHHFLSLVFHRRSDRPGYELETHADHQKRLRWNHLD
jgi:hypothetical protein